MQRKNKRHFLVLAPQSLTSATVEMVIVPICSIFAEQGASILMLLLHHDIKNNPKKRIRITDNFVAEYVGQMMVRRIGNYKVYMTLPELVYAFFVSIIGMLRKVLSEQYDFLLSVKSMPHIIIVSILAKIIKRKPLVLFSDDLEVESNKLPNNFFRMVFTFGCCIE